MLFYPSNPGVLRVIFVVPNITLMNVMVSRVFRNTILFETWSETDFYHPISKDVLLYEKESGP